jgi:membrane fusion protein
MPDLFRQEVIDAGKSHFLGTIRIARNPRFTVVTTVALVLALALVAYGVWGEVARKARVAGVLVPAGGTLSLSATQGGTLVDIRVKQGDRVEARQPLALVSADRRTSEGDAETLIAQSLEQRRAMLESERALAEVQFRQRQQAIDDRLRSLDAEAQQAEAELANMGRRIELASKSVERFTEMARIGYVSQLQLQQKQEELLEHTARESTSRRSLLSLRRDAQTLRNEQTANVNALKAQLTQIDRGLASLRQEKTENSIRREHLIVAPEAGTVTALTAHRGQHVRAGQTLLVLVPGSTDGRATTLEAQLFAPSRTAGFVQPGQDVWIRYDAYSYQKFGMAKGRVAAVSRTPINPQDLPQGDASQSVEPLYRVTVTLDKQAIKTYGEVQPLKAGMTLAADVVQERLRIWEWLFDPVLAASGLAIFAARRGE